MNHEMLKPIRLLMMILSVSSRPRHLVRVRVKGER